MAFLSSAIDALGMMIQVVGNLEATVKSKDLSSIHSEDVVLNESLAAILQEADRIEPARHAQFRADVTRFGQHVIKPTELRVKNFREPGTVPPVPGYPGE